MSSSSRAQRRGLGKWLVETIVAQPLLQQIRLFVLGTRDAHGLYERHGGFEPLKAPERWLARAAPTVGA
jgi:GNAT superfamily N-acetyltransferase